MSHQYWHDTKGQSHAKLFLVLLTLSLMVRESCQVQSANRYDFLKQTHQPYCTERVLGKQQLQSDMVKWEMRKMEIREWIPVYADHLIEAIVLLCNNKPAEVQALIHKLINYTLIYAQPFLIALGLLALLGGTWVYMVLWKPPLQNASFQTSVEHPVQHYPLSSLRNICSLTLLNNICWKVIAISLLLCICVCLYGILEAQQIERTLNRFWCLLVQQENGYIRDIKGNRGTLLDFASEINNFQASLTQKNAAINAQLSQLQTKEIIGESFQLSQKLAQKSKQLAKYSKDLSITLQGMIVGEQSALQYFNSTIEYQRQVLIGFTFVKGNIDRYAARFFGFENISKIFSEGAQILLWCVTAIALSSLVGMWWFINRQTPLYFKYIIQYALTVMCAFCMVCAVLNSFMTMLLNSLIDLGPYILVPGNPRNLFLSTGSLNDPLVQIMASFWPQASGNMSDYGNSSLLLSLNLIDHQINTINEFPLWKENNIQDSLITFKKALQATQKEVNATRQLMIGDQGLGKLDPRAFGRNIFDTAMTAAVNIFNRTYEQRKIFGITGFCLLTAILFSICIVPGSNDAESSYVKANQVDIQIETINTKEPSTQEETEMLDH